jgi:hypothetical protein
MARPKSKKDGRGTNLYLSETVTSAASKIAAEYYGNRSLSWLVERLLKREIRRREGLAA